MANEATLVFRVANPINFITADANALTKGQILKLTDPMTCSGATALNDTIAGIAAVDKIASDGVTEVGVFREGLFRVYVSGSVSVGDSVVHSGTANFVMVAGQTLSGSKVLGVMLETASTGETGIMELNIR